MHISFSPVRSDDTLSVSKVGDVITINGDSVDLSAVPEGASLPTNAIGNPWIVGDVRRHDGNLHITLLLPHGPSPSKAVAFPVDLNAPPDGDLILPQDVKEA